MRWLYELADNKDFVGLFESLETAMDAAAALSGTVLLWHDDADDPGAGWFATAPEERALELVTPRWEIMRLPLYETALEATLEPEEGR